jgi:hypothetical protein
MSFGPAQNDGILAFQTDSTPPSMSARMSAGRRLLVVSEKEPSVVFLEKMMKMKRKSLILQNSAVFAPVTRIHADRFDPLI